MPPQVGRQGDGPVVPLGAAGGEDDLPSLAAQGLGHRLPMGGQRLGCLGPQGVQGGRVAIVLRHGTEGRLGGFRQHPGGGGVVKIDRFHSLVPSFLQTLAFIVRFPLQKVKAGGQAPSDALCKMQQRTRRHKGSS